MEITLDTTRPNQAILTVGSAELFFSYAACIAVRDTRHGTKAFNPAYRGYSVTTSRHASAMGCKDFPDAATEIGFQQAVQRALDSED